MKAIEARGTMYLADMDFPLLLEDTDIKDTEEVLQSDWKTDQFFSRRRKQSIFQIFVSTWMNKTICLDVTAFETTESVKTMIQDKVGCPADEQMLVFGGK